MQGHLKKNFRGAGIKKGLGTTVLGNQGVTSVCDIHLPRLGFLGLQVRLTIGHPPFLHLIERKIPPKISKNNTPLPTTLRLCPGSLSHAAFLLLLLQARCVAFVRARTWATIPTLHIDSPWVMLLLIC